MSSTPPYLVRLSSLADLDRFDDLIDVRSPAEFLEDSPLGAHNFPVLSDQERAEVGTLYVQTSAFAAKKRGAAYVASNIGAHLQSAFFDRPKNWRPLIFCWRGGERSAAFTHVLRKIGFDAHQLIGGYKSYRTEVMRYLEEKPATLHWHVISGPTGSGKSRLLERLQQEGAQVLHLEALAAHKGSVLGVLPYCPQPSQKAFESALARSLMGFSSDRPVFVESESRKIGALYIPNALFAALKNAPVTRLQTPMQDRLALLMSEYAHFLAEPHLLTPLIEALSPWQPKTRIAAWQSLIATGDLPTLVLDLLEQHYDPLYERSQAVHPPIETLSDGSALETWLHQASLQGCETAACGR